MSTDTTHSTNTQRALLAVDLTKVCDVPFKGQMIDARVAKVVDGDTIKVVIMMGDCPLMVSIRVIGVDCPESTKAKAKSVLEMNAGNAVKQHIYSLLTVGELVMVKLIKKDMYCRFDGDIYRNGCSLSEYLLTNRLAKAYGGAKKEDWKDDELNHIISHCS